MSTLPAQTTTKKTVKEYLDSPAIRADLAKALPKHMTPDRQLRVMFTTMNKIPKLKECTVESLGSCLLQLSALGLEPDGRRAHLIPYRDNRTNTSVCTLIVDYKGMVELAMNSGKVSSIHADKVCDADLFEVDRGRITQHKIDYRKPRGDVYAFYSIITFKDGGEKCEVMTVDEVDAIRKRSKAGNAGPWVTDYDEMGKKTVFKRASKWIPQSPELRDALEADDEPKTTVTSEPANELRVIPMPKDEPDQEPEVQEGSIEVQTFQVPEEPISMKEELWAWSTAKEADFDTLRDAMIQAKIVTSEVADLWDDYSFIAQSVADKALRNKQVLSAFIAKVKGGKSA